MSIASATAIVPGAVAPWSSSVQDYERYDSSFSSLSPMGEEAMTHWSSNTEFAFRECIPTWRSCPNPTSTSIVGPFCEIADGPLHEDAAHLTPIVSIGQTYTLTAEETDQCIRIGRERNAKNIQQKTKNLNFSKRDDEQISIQGVVGELAFSRMFGIPIEIYDTTCRNAHNDTFDAVLPNGWSVDVKTTVRLDAPIIVSTWKRVRPPHLYALIILENYASGQNITINRLPRVCFKGFVQSSVILQDANLHKMKSTGFVHYRWPQNRLCSLEQILQPSITSS